MLKTIGKHLAFGVIALSAAGFVSSASADHYEQHDDNYYWKGGGWTVGQYHTERKGWCAVHVDYRGGERLSLIGTKDEWTLRLSHPGWNGLEAGRRYDLVLRTDGGWSVGYQAWGYRAAKGGRGGFTMPTFPRAMDALSHAGEVYFIDQSGATLAALDLSGSARAIAALRECRADLARNGGFGGRRPSRQSVSSGPAISPIELPDDPSARNDAPSNVAAADVEAVGVDVTPLDTGVAENLPNGGEATRADGEDIQVIDVTGDDASTAAAVQPQAVLENANGTTDDVEVEAEPELSPDDVTPQAQ